MQPNTSSDHLFRTAANEELKHSPPGGTPPSNSHLILYL
jgi:hypothetical protein